MPFDDLDSHCTVEFVEYCIEHDIHPFSGYLSSLPPLQPLGASPFRQPQIAYTAEQDGWHRKGNNAVRKGNFQEYYSHSTENCINFWLEGIIRARDIA